VDSPSPNSEVEDAVKEWLKCRMSFVYFALTYCYINDADRGAIPFNPKWQHLIGVARDLATYRLVIVYKSRQVGMTWLMACYAMWRALFYEGANVIIISKGQDEAAETLDYCKFILNHLPPYLKVELGRDQSKIITIPSMHSRLRALPTTKDAGIGFGSASLIILDEFDAHEYAEQNFLALKPMIDAGGKRQFVVLSARAPEHEDNSKFASLWADALDGKSKFHPIFIPWNAVPGRTQEWFDDLKRDMDEWQVESQYPSNERDILKASIVQMYFDKSVLDAMKIDCRKPVEYLHHDTIKVWKPPVVGKRYAMAVDPSEGYDASVAAVLDVQLGEIVAMSHGKYNGDELASICCEMYDHYYRPFLSVERNSIGVNLIDKMFAAGCRNWFSDKPEKLGFYMGTSNASGRNAVLNEYSNALKQRQFVVYDPEAIEEHYWFMHIPGEKPHPPKGKADDYVMCFAQLWHIKGKMPQRVAHAYSGVYKESFR
jgi:hypothetical protein